AGPTKPPAIPRPRTRPASAPPTRRSPAPHTGTRARIPRARYKLATRSSGWRRKRRTASTRPQSRARAPQASLRRQTLPFGRAAMARPASNRVAAGKALGDRAHQAEHFTRRLFRRLIVFFECIHHVAVRAIHAQPLGEIRHHHAQPRRRNALHDLYILVYL